MSYTVYGTIRRDTDVLIAEVKPEPDSAEEPQPDGDAAMAEDDAEEEV